MDRMPAFGPSGRYGWIGLTVALAACGGGSSGTSESGDSGPADQNAAIQTADDERMAVLESVYLNRRVPDGFYGEAEPAPGVFQTITHIKNTGIAAPSPAEADTPRYELCAGDFDQALQWSIAAGDDQGQLVDNRETELFFEFVRVPQETPSFENIQRVFKCAMLDRSTVDLDTPDEHRGLYTELPQSTDSIKLIIEYLWTLSESNNYGNAVLSSETAEADSHYTHTLARARLTPANEPGEECDQVDVYDTRYRVDKLTGSINVSESHRQRIFGRNDNGQISVCRK